MNIRRRFWIEIALAVIASVLFVMTMMWKEWIEIVFDVDPDRGSGALEWTIVLAFMFASIVFSISARREWRRTERPLSESLPKL